MNELYFTGIVIFTLLSAVPKNNGQEEAPLIVTGPKPEESYLVPDSKAPWPITKFRFSIDGCVTETLTLHSHKHIPNKDEFNKNTDFLIVFMPTKNKKPKSALQCSPNCESVDAISVDTSKGVVCGNYTKYWLAVDRSKLLIGSGCDVNDQKTILFHFTFSKPVPLNYISLGISQKINWKIDECEEPLPLFWPKGTETKMSVVGPVSSKESYHLVSEGIASWPVTLLRFSLKGCGVASIRVHPYEVMPEKDPRYVAIFMPRFGNMPRKAMQCTPDCAFVKNNLTEMTEKQTFQMGYECKADFREYWLKIERFKTVVGSGCNPYNEDTIMFETVYPSEILVSYVSLLVGTFVEWKFDLEKYRHVKGPLVNNTLFSLVPRHLITPIEVFWFSVKTCYQASLVLHKNKYIFNASENSPYIILYFPSKAVGPPYALICKSECDMVEAVLSDTYEAQMEINGLQCKVFKYFWIKIINRKILVGSGCDPTADGTLMASFTFPNTVTASQISLGVFLPTEWKLGLCPQKEVPETKVLMEHMAAKAQSDDASQTHVDVAMLILLLPLLHIIKI